MDIRATYVMLSAYIVAMLVASALFAALRNISPATGIFLALLVLALLVATGTNAAGALLMDRANGGPRRDLGEALVFGASCLPKVLVVIGAAGAIALAIFLAIALILFLSKMAGIGPALFAVVYPASVVIAGITIIGLAAGASIMLPAIWEGAGIRAAAARLIAIARTRFIEASVLLLAAYLVAGVVALIVSVIFWTGFFPVSEMVASIVGAAPWAWFSAGPELIYGKSSLPGYGWAAMLGSTFLLALAGALVLHVLLLVLNLVYLHLIEGLDPEFEKSVLARGREQAKLRAARLSETGRMPRSAPTLVQTGTLQPGEFGGLSNQRSFTAAPETGAACPACHGLVSSEDAFCEHCGHKLR